MMPELKAPTVVIVDDRIDLETQITVHLMLPIFLILLRRPVKKNFIAFFRLICERF
jgi:type I restriction enzyme R subunit